MPSEKPRDELCGAQCRNGGYCTQYPVEGSERCRMHGGTNPGPPKGSANGLTHGVTADPVNLYKHLPDHQQEWIEAMVEAYIEHLELDEDDPRISKLRRAVTNELQAWRGDAHILEEGMSEDTTIGISDRGEPIVKKDEHHLHRFVLDREQESRMTLKDLGALNPPEQQRADAEKGIIDLFTELEDVDEVEDENQNQADADAD